ncbi:MAG: hypothetical protein S4CHLAM2_08100 [Chlamydiales bacterium]|nr:hypothetical protein [Chlamydiales bacterium]
MRALLVYGLLLGAPLCAAPLHAPKAQAKPLPVGPKINVLLEKNANSALLEVKGGYRVIRQDSGSVLSAGNSGKRFMVHALQDGLRWGEEYPDVYQISVIPTHPDTLVYVNGIQYRGSVSVYHVRDNLITVVNELPIEEYLKSTLALQFETSLPKEALAALVIAARTEAYSKVLRGQSTNRPWHVAAQEVSYYGYGVMHQKNRVEESVDATRFMVMESVNRGGPAQNTQLPQAKAVELAELGLNAKKILQSAYPNQPLGLTIDAGAVVVR